MLRQEIYLKELHGQLKQIMHSSTRSYLSISPINNPFYAPASILLGFAAQLADQLINKQNKTEQEFIYLIVALHTTGQGYLSQLSEFKLAYPLRDHSATIEKFTSLFAATGPKQPSLTKDAIRRKYQKLLGKAEAEGYFCIPQVPVFLVSTRWLQRFYSSDSAHPGPVSNQCLLEPTVFPLADPEHSHYNYKVRADVRENEDFKVLPYQAWQLLEQTYGGVEVKRFTTKEKVPTVQIWYSEVSLWVVQQRAILGRVQMLICKNQIMEKVLQRLRLTLLKYKVAPEVYLARQPTVYKLKGVGVEQFPTLLHSENHTALLAQRLQKIGNWGIQFQQVSIFSVRDSLLVNVNVGASLVFGQAGLLRVVEMKEKCLRCGSTDNLELCRCKSVYFCSRKCREDHREHLRECNSIQADIRKFNQVTEGYNVRKRELSKVGDLVPLGKLGFENLGNTCYMNAALQCVLRLEPLVRPFLTNQHLKDLNVGNVLGSEGYLACAYGELAKTFYSSSRRSLQPNDLLRVVARNAQFRGYNHQDSQQFLNYFLDKLHEDLNRVRVKPTTEDVESNGRPDELVSALSWDNFRKRNDSLVTDALAGQYRSEIRCPDCQKLSITFDPFLSLTLQFPRPEKSVQLEGFFMNELGEFQKFSTEARATMPAHQFYSKFFWVPVYGVYQSQRRISDTWNPSQTVFQNKKQKGLLFFYEKPLGHAVEVQFQIYSPGKKEPENFVRVVFMKEVNSEKELKEAAFKVIRKPVQKALQKDYNSDDYLAMCHERDFLKIKGIKAQPMKEQLFPVVGAAVLRIQVEVDCNKLKSMPLKLNVSNLTYEGRGGSLLRKVGNQLSVQELLTCFSQPERLSQENAWYCNVCKEHKLAEKKMELYRTPNNLIVHLKRFNHRGDSGNRFVIYGEKVNTPIALEEVQTIKGRRYELVGIVNHVGTLMHGHYTAAVKRDGWYLYDDSRCTRTQSDGRNAYLLFYQLAS